MSNSHQTAQMRDTVGRKVILAKAVEGKVYSPKKRYQKKNARVRWESAVMDTGEKGNSCNRARASILTAKADKSQAGRGG